MLSHDSRDTAAYTKYGTGTSEVLFKGRDVRPNMPNDEVVNHSALILGSHQTIRTPENEGEALAARPH